MKKIIITVIVIVIVILLIWWWQSQNKILAPADLGMPEGDTTNAISQQLESIDISDLEAEFQAIDVDLNNL